MSVNCCSCSLLAQFQALLQRDTLQQELETKYSAIFQHYARDLEAVQVGTAQGILFAIVLCGSSLPLIVLDRVSALKLSILPSSQACMHGVGVNQGFGCTRWLHIQAIYEKEKHRPPLPRNAPPISGMREGSHNVPIRPFFPARVCDRRANALIGVVMRAHGGRRKHHVGAPVAASH